MIVIWYSHDHDIEHKGQANLCNLSTNIPHKWGKKKVRKTVKGQYPYMDCLEFSSGALIQNAFYIYIHPAHCPDRGATVTVAAFMLKESPDPLCADIIKRAGKARMLLNYLDSSTHLEYYITYPGPPKKNIQRKCNHIYIYRHNMHTHHIYLYI